jgi:hypothetical protein
MNILAQRPPGLTIGNNSSIEALYAPLSVREQN